MLFLCALSKQIFSRHHCLEIRATLCIGLFLCDEEMIENHRLAGDLNFSVTVDWYYFSREEENF